MYIDLGGSQAASKNSKSSIQVIWHFLFKVYQSGYFITFLYIVELRTSIQSLFSGKYQNLLACQRRPSNWEHLNLKISYCKTIWRFITTAKLIISKIFNTFIKMLKVVNTRYQLLKIQCNILY